MKISLKKSDTYEDPLKNEKFKILLNSTEIEYIFY